MAINASLSFPGNATVPPPPNGYIQPPSKFVFWLQNLAQNQGGIDISNQGITYFSSALLANRLNQCFSFGLPASFYLNGNALSTDSIDPILDELLVQASSVPLYNGTADVSGGSNSPPTPYQNHIDGYAEIAVTSPQNGDQFYTSTYSNYVEDYLNCTFTFDDTVNLADSTWSWGPGGYATIGIQDNPSDSDIAEKVAEVLGALGVAVSTGNTVHLTITDDGLLASPEGWGGGPSAFAIGVEVGTPITINTYIQGQAFYENYSEHELVTYFGWTITTN